MNTEKNLFRLQKTGVGILNVFLPITIMAFIITCIFTTASYSEVIKVKRTYGDVVVFLRYALDRYECENKTGIPRLAQDIVNEKSRDIRSIWLDEDYQCALIDRSNFKQGLLVYENNIWIIHREHVILFCLGCNEKEYEKFRALER